MTVDVTEDRDAGIVSVDGHYIDGWIADSTCQHCSDRLVYSERYDAYLCPRCNVWTHPKCPDSYCTFCAARPDHPISTK